MSLHLLYPRYGELKKVDEVFARRHILRAYENLKNISRVSRLFRTTRKTVRGILKRYKSMNHEGLKDMPKRPKRSPKRTPYRIVSYVHLSSVHIPPNTPGELLVSSGHMVRGYWKKERETKECFVEQDGRLWYRTRDIVRIDSDGWLYYLDRSADVIKHKGYRVSASEIEATLKEHPCVVESCVVGVPDEKVGERIKAFVVLKEDAKGVSAYDLVRWCRERLAPYKVPQYIEFRDMLPKSKVGKILRRELRDEERKKKEI